MSDRRGCCLLVIVLALGACGIDADAGPRDLGDAVVGAEVPPLRPAVPGPTTSEAGSVLATAHFVNQDGDLIPVNRQLGPASPSDQLAELAGLLVDGPTAGEAQLGLRSAVPPTTDVLGVELDEGVATVDLSSSFASIGGRDEILAVGQLVLSVITFPGVRAVTFHLEGRPIGVPLPDGALTEEPVTLDQFTVLLERRTAPPSTGQTRGAATGN